MAASFYVTLPSNGSMTVFPDNKITEYKNKLPKPLHLDGEWEVGLVECTYPFSWFQICAETTRVALKHRGSWRTAPILPVKSFADKHELAEKKWFNDNHKVAIQMSGVDANGRVKMKNGSSYEVRLEGKICQTLGVDDPHVMATDWERGRYPWTKQNINQIFVYTDIIAPYPVGDREVPLLKHFSVNNSAEFGSHVDVVPPLTAYHPISRNPIDTIEIAFRDGTGRKIPFTTGRTVVTLHFRQRRSSLL